MVIKTMQYFENPLHILNIFIEYGKIRFFSKKKAKKITVIYDYSCSPPTYGDFLVVVLMARFFYFKKFKINFILINSSFRDDWNLISEESKKQLLSDHQKLIMLLMENKVSLIKLSWNEFFEKCKSPDFNSSNILFKYRVFRRKEIYSQSINFTNLLMRNQKKIFKTKYLLNINNNPFYNYSINPKAPYITVHFRYSRTHSINRNISEKEFVHYIRMLSKKFGGMKIVVLSDNQGCEHYKKIALKNKFYILFSNSYSKSFLGDCSLILNSNFYFQFKGGGIGIIPMYSNVSYEISSCFSTERMVNKNHLFSWQQRNQITVNLFNEDQLKI